MAPSPFPQREAQIRFRDRAGGLTDFERNVLLMLSRQASHAEIAFIFRRPEAEVFEAAWRGRAKLEGTL